MKYNPFGYRFFSGESDYNGDVFIYSSQGQLVAKYSILGNTLRLDYLPIYEGTKRIGIVEPEGIEWEYCPDIMVCPREYPDITVFRTMFSVERYGLKSSRKYELTDHLGNVRVVIADQRVPVSTNGSTVAYYKPLVKSIHDYYPFGWEKQLTTVNPYPFNYQGQLFDRELGWQYYRYRNYDPIIARFYQVEPLVDEYPWLGYVFAEDKVIYGVEIEGLEYSPVTPAQGGTVSNPQPTTARDNTSVVSVPHGVGSMMVSSDGSNDDKLQEYLVISVTLPSDNTTTGQQLVEYGEMMQWVGLGLEAAGVAVILLTGGAGAPVGVLMIKAGAVVGTAGATLEVTGYVLDERYTDAMISAMSAFASISIGRAGDKIFQSLQHVALSDLPDYLQQAVKAGAIDAPRIGVEQVKDVMIDYYVKNSMNSSSESGMCVMPSEDIEKYKNVKLMQNRENSATADDSGSSNTSSQSISQNGSNDN